MDDVLLIAYVCTGPVSSESPNRVEAEKAGARLASTCSVAFPSYCTAGGCSWLLKLFDVTLLQKILWLQKGKTNGGMCKCYCEYCNTGHQIF